MGPRASGRPGPLPPRRGRARVLGSGVRCRDLGRLGDPGPFCFLVSRCALGCINAGLWWLVGPITLGVPLGGMQAFLVHTQTRAGCFWRSLDPLAIEYCGQRGTILESPPYHTALSFGGYPGSPRNKMIKGNNPPATPQGPFPDPRALNSFYNLLWARLEFSLEGELVGTDCCPHLASITL